MSQVRHLPRVLVAADTGVDISSDDGPGFRADGVDTRVHDGPDACTDGAESCVVGGPDARTDDADKRADTGPDACVRGTNGLLLLSLFVGSMSGLRVPQLTS